MATGLDMEPLRDKVRLRDRDGAERFCKDLCGPYPARRLQVINSGMGLGGGGEGEVG